MNMGLFGIWLAMQVDWIVRSIIFVSRFISGKWDVNIFSDRKLSNNFLDRNLYQLLLSRVGWRFAKQILPDLDNAPQA